MGNQSQQYHQTSPSPSFSNYYQLTSSKKTNKVFSSSNNLNNNNNNNNTTTSTTNYYFDNLNQINVVESAVSYDPQAQNTNIKVSQYFII